MRNESYNEYLHQLYDMKDIKGYTWQDIANMVNAKYGTKHSPDRFRKDAYKYYNEQAQVLDLATDLNQVRQERNQINAVIRNHARDVTLKDIAVEVAEKVGRNKLLDKPKKIKARNDKVGILCIGDWHFGLLVDTLYNKYDEDIAKERVSKLLAETKARIEKENINNLVVVNLGDLISGKIHLGLQINSRINAIEQTEFVSELLAEFLTELTKECKVEYWSVLDNHSRLDPNKDNAIRTEQLSHITDWYLPVRMKGNKNITFNRHDNMVDIATFEVLGHKVAATHGDRDKQKKLIDSVGGYFKEHFDLILTAHLHHFTADEKNETLFLCNGSLIGTDDYAESLRLNSKPSQLFLVATKDDITSVIYKIIL